MKIALSILGILFILVGVVWILQGINILLGSFMSGHIQYTILGVIVFVVGVVLIAFANRRNKTLPR